MVKKQKASIEAFFFVAGVGIEPTVSVSFLTAYEAWRLPTTSPQYVATTGIEPAFSELSPSEF